MDLETRVMIPRHEQINDLAGDDFLPKLSGQKTCSEYFRDHISRKLVWMVEYILFENFTQNQGMDVWVKIKKGNSETLFNKIFLKWTTTQIILIKQFQL